MAGRVFPRRRLHQTLISRSGGSPASRSKSELSAHPYCKLTGPFNENVQLSRSCVFNKKTPGRGPQALSPRQQSARCGDTGGSSRHAPPPRTTLCPLRIGLGTLASAPPARPSRGYLRHRGAHCGGATQRSVPTPGGRQGRAGPPREQHSDGAGRPMLHGVPGRPGALRDGRGWGRGVRDPALQNGAAPDPPPAPSRGIPEPGTSRPRRGTAWRGAPPPPAAAAARRVPPGSAVSGAAPSPDRRRRRARALTAPPPRTDRPPPPRERGRGCPVYTAPPPPPLPASCSTGGCEPPLPPPRRAGPRQVGEPCRAGAAAGSSTWLALTQLPSCMRLSATSLDGVEDGLWRRRTEHRGAQEQGAWPGAPSGAVQQLVL
nr:basic proline-rich protein-like [Taeniopygia guttata]